MLKSLSLAAVFLLISCQNAKNNGTPTEKANNAAGTENAIVPGIDVTNASQLECSAGGKVYTVYLDTNRNGTYESDEHTVSAQIVCNGVDGLNGTNGVNGNAGLGMVFQTIVATANQCSAGGVTILMALDTDRSLSLTLTDENLQSVTICNGSNGNNGTDGHDGAPAPITGFTPVDSIAACGNTVSYKEILLLLQNGQVLGSFSNSTNGDMTRLAFLPDGVFMNTDTSGCVFTLSTSIDGTTRSVSWNNQVQMSWPLLPL